MPTLMRRARRTPLLLVFGLGIWEVVLIAGVLLLLFGARKLPALARGLGSGIRNFKGEIKSGGNDERDERTLEDGDGPSR
jgi:sec-independent protein translocase protein TatA